MSVAIGIECEGGVWLAADSVEIAGGTHDVTGGKLARFGGYAIASVGFVRACQVLRHYLDLPGPVGDEPAEKWMVTSLVPALKVLADEHDPWPEEEDGGWALLVAVAGELYSVDRTYAVGRSLRGYAAIGSASDFALGAIAATKGMDQPQDRLIAAVKAAAEWSTSALEPCELQWVPA